MATQNKKFETFVDTIFKSKLPAIEIKDHIVKYVQALETNYTEVVRDFKDIIEKEKTQYRKMIGEQANSQVERSELESLFITCVEETRKSIMKRRLKNELQTKSYQVENKTTEETRDFEDSLLRLA